MRLPSLLRRLTVTPFWPGDLISRLALRLAVAFAADEQALAAAGEIQLELGDGRVGDGFEVGAQALPTSSSRSSRRAGCRSAHAGRRRGPGSSWLDERRNTGPESGWSSSGVSAVAVPRIESGRAGALRELDLGADVADVGVVEQQRLRHRDRRPSQMSASPGFGGQHRLDRRVAASLGRAPVSLS